MNVTESAAWTAIGTLTLAVMTLAAVITTVIITVTDRRRADRQVGAERTAAREREQLEEAYSVQVILGDRLPPRDVGGSRGDAGYRVAAIVINRGRYMITGLEAQLRISGPGNPSLVSLPSRERVPATRDLDPRLRSGMNGSLEETGHADRLAPWDLGMRFESDGLAGNVLSGAYPVVRWTDRWGTWWEHRRGDVRQIRDGQDWLLEWTGG